MTAYQLDLRDLDDEKIDEALPHMDICTYRAPCIIGTLMPEYLRDSCDEADMGTPAGIDKLVSEGIISFPDEVQSDLASKLQGAFDNSDRELFWECIGEIRKLKPKETSA